MIKTTLNTAAELAKVVGKLTVVTLNGVNAAHKAAKDSFETYKDLSEQGTLFGPSAFYQKSQVDHATDKLKALFTEADEK